MNGQYSMHIDFLTLLRDDKKISNVGGVIQAIKDKNPFVDSILISYRGERISDTTIIYFPEHIILNLLSHNVAFIDTDTLKINVEL